MESTSTFNARLVPNCRHSARSAPALRKRIGYAAAVIANLREFAPYALIELVLPGGSPWPGESRVSVRRPQMGESHAYEQTC
jgi:hypothetical protein